MEAEADRLRRLLEGDLDEDNRAELETKLADRPSLREQLADMALDAERTRRTTAAVRITSDAWGEDPAELSTVGVGPLLGRGGMAVVHLGQQLKLDRAVALKSLREEYREPDDVSRLLREARITGRLEHPNIVPVHDIVTGPDGLPQVVLKRIEGETWSKLMKNAALVQDRFGADDLLEWNLDVLMAVARALSFAHSRRIIHRDVKPSNVMVGSFGEVYLMDWGIAYDLDGPPELEEEGQPSGTTGYMSPEQLGHHDGRLGPWTDTYLLGATLYHLLTGRPPHAGIPVVDRIDDPDPVPPIPEHVPEELRRLLMRALDPNPITRTTHPEDLRREVLAFLSHRAALRLADRGDRAREEAEAPGLDAVGFEETALAADLAYRAALEEWPACEQARTGRRAVQTLRVQRALDDDDLHLARRLASTSEELPRELRERLRRAMADASATAAKIEQLVKDADRGLGHRARGVFGGGFALLWVGFWGTVAFRPPETIWPLVGFTLGVLLVGSTVIRLKAPQLLENRINRTSIMVVIGSLLMLSVWCIGAHFRGFDMATVITGYLFVGAFFTSGMATLMDPWGAVSACGFAVAFIIASAWPPTLPYAVVGANVVMLLNQLILNFARARRGFSSLPPVPP